MTLEQTRMKNAFDAVPKTTDAELKDQWRTAVLGLAVSIRRSGLLHAFAFLHRDNGGTKGVAGSVEAAVRKHLRDANLLTQKEAEGEFLQTLMNMADADRFLRLTREALAFAHWLHRATQAREQG